MTTTTGSGPTIKSRQLGYCIVDSVVCLFARYLSSGQGPDKEKESGGGDGGRGRERERERELSEEERSTVGPTGPLASVRRTDGQTDRLWKVRKVNRCPAGNIGLPEEDKLRKDEKTVEGCGGSSSASAVSGQGRAADAGPKPTAVDRGPSQGLWTVDRVAGAMCVSPGLKRCQEIDPILLPARRPRPRPSARCARRSVLQGKESKAKERVTCNLQGTQKDEKEGSKSTHTHTHKLSERLVWSEAVRSRKGNNDKTRPEEKRESKYVVR
ncbi:hypothetical protein AXG93_3818s1470 [Marchantia polymorpha subsp. ruderalis]|uniref:Uncharacterized protein n=1 Tax=Marchantia polymorpha subsp. ruderalis TaxID=1480154 RepID=A0A176VGR5_MARPO|nr:hypothetical protein AXG93_3818s1470 [Marchantia polymorpha subsp. ruderalis]